jgi:hypothetical protein
MGSGCVQSLPLHPCTKEPIVSIVRVLSPCVVVFDGVPVSLHPDQPFDSDDPIVEHYPHLFGADNSDVEQASAAPGEKRTAKR